MRTRRFLLRPLETEDARRVAILCNDRELARNSSRIPLPYSLKDAQKFIRDMQERRANGSEFSFAVCQEGELIGCVGTVAGDANRFEIGYWVGKGYRGNGVATESACAIIQFSFDHLGATSVSAGYIPENIASGRVLKKLGFRETGEILPIHSAGRGEVVDTIRVEMTRDEYEQSNRLQDVREAVLSLRENN